MKKTIILTMVLSLILNANTLKEDEFDVQKLGQVFENYILKNDKQFQNIELKYNEKIEALNNEITELKEKIQTLELARAEKFVNITPNEIVVSEVIPPVPQNDINTTSAYIKDMRTVNTKKGIIAYSEPLSVEDLLVTRYAYGVSLEIDNCHENGWCKLMDKNEYVAEYLLIKNEN